MNAKTKGSPFKWLGAMVMSLLMVLACLPTIALAEGRYDITVQNNSAEATHKYTAYQIFTGTLADGDTTHLAVKGFGANLTRAGKDALANAAGYRLTDDDAADALAIAEFFAGENFDKSALAADLAENASKYWQDASGNAVNAGSTTVAVKASGNITVTDLGYYLLIDKATNTKNEQTAEGYILTIVGSATVAPKADVPSVIKKVQDTENTNWRKSADWNIGSSIPYQLTATLPTSKTAWAEYSTFEIEFVDNLSKGLDYDSNTCVVYIEKADGTRYVVREKALAVDSNETAKYTEGTVLTLNLTLRSTTDGVASDVLTGTKDGESYTATAGDKIVVEYNAKLNDKAVIGADGNPNDVVLRYTRNPNVSDTSKPNTGETPPDKVIVFTYEVDVDKVDGQGNPLKGAGFTIYAAGSETPIKWKLNEDKGYYVVSNDADAKAELSGENMVKFQFAGLGAGTYTLSETTTPTGYNTAADIEFTITAIHSDVADEPALTALEITPADMQWSANKTTGVVSGKVVNNSGATLPSTGGMGTTLLYAVGGALVVVAAGILIYKKVRPQES